ncbi:GNAT family N-acetyltransferase [Candidatus Margulisiibacteriota bacterium]
MEMVEGMRGVGLRKALPEDSADILEWRNDPLTIENSFNAQPVSSEDHQQWFSSALNNADKLLLIGVSGSEKTGVVRFDKLEDGVYEISINVAPGSRGKGLGVIMLKQAGAWVKGRVVARIKKGNVPSIKTFEKAGYNLINDDGQNLELEL